VRKKLVEKADNDCVDAYVLDYRPVFELGASLSANIEKLIVAEIHFGLVGLLDVHFVLAHGF
jgi:hypothetical protein